jgi:hypothetical protein
VQEIHHNTPAQVEQYLATALALVHELAITDPALRVVALTKAVDLLAAKQVIVEQADVSRIARAGVPML